jgi:hypothetical protein
MTQYYKPCTRLNFGLQVPVTYKFKFAFPYQQNFYILVLELYDFSSNLKTGLNKFGLNFSNLVYFFYSIKDITNNENFDNFKVSKTVQVPTRRPPSPGTGTRPDGLQILH